MSSPLILGPSDSCNWSHTHPPFPSKMGLGKKDWNWRRNDPLYPATYYEASLAAFKEYEALSSDKSCDVVVVGAGLLGASTALHLVEAGIDTILIEANCVGGGASGRNGGQLTPGLARWKAEDMLRHFDNDTATRFWRLTSHESMSLLNDLFDRYSIDADYKAGHLTCCIHPGHLQALQRSVDARKKLNDYSGELIDRDKLKDFVLSDLYFGALYDQIGGQLHPLALNRGLVSAFEKLGGVIFEKTAVAGLSRESGRLFVHTSGGRIEVKRAVVTAAHHNTPDLLPNKRHVSMPFHTYIGVTESLSVPLTELLPGNKPIYDTQLQIDYYRAVRENRILFGGQGTGSCWTAKDIMQYLKKRLKTVFPRLASTEFDFLWAGTSDITVNGAVACRKDGTLLPTYFIHGWNGHGVAQSVRIGKAVAQDIAGSSDDLEMLLSIEHRNYPGLGYLGGALIPIIKSGLALKQKIRPEALVSF